MLEAIFLRSEEYHQTFRLLVDLLLKIVLLAHPNQKNVLILNPNAGFGKCRTSKT